MKVCLFFKVRAKVAILLSVFAFAPFVASRVVAQSPSALPYRDPRLPTAQRVADLLSRMTLEEKGQRFGSNSTRRVAEGATHSA